MPAVERSEVADLLTTRRYVIVQGPPGTGKTMMATELLHGEYANRGRSIQFHPNTTYETFIGGLTPATTSGDLGLRFTPSPGALMETAAQALSDPEHNYLLHIDEINRADLAKILGEAIFLLEHRRRMAAKSIFLMISANPSSTHSFCRRTCTYSAR